jgi:hypothetical protein
MNILLWYLPFTIFVAACEALTADGEAVAPTDWSTKPPQAWRSPEAQPRTAVMARRTETVSTDAIQHLRAA